jgi:hypothetical protein
VDCGGICISHTQLKVACFPSAGELIRLTHLAPVKTMPSVVLYSVLTSPSVTPAAATVALTTVADRCLRHCKTERKHCSSTDHCRCCYCRRPYDPRDLTMTSLSVVTFLSRWATLIESKRCLEPVRWAVLYVMKHKKIVCVGCELIYRF